MGSQYSIDCVSQTQNLNCCSARLDNPNNSERADDKENDTNSAVMQRMRLWSQKNVVSLKICEYAEEDHADGINHLCEKQGAVVYINFLAPGGFAPLHLAAMRGSKNALRVLLDHGADINLRSESGWTAAQLARVNGHPDVADILDAYKGPSLRHSRSPALAASHIFKNGRTPSSHSNATPPSPVSPRDVSTPGIGIDKSRPQPLPTQAQPVSSVTFNLHPVPERDLPPLPYTPIETAIRDSSPTATLPTDFTTTEKIRSYKELGS